MKKTSRILLLVALSMIAACRSTNSVATTLPDPQIAAATITPTPGPLWDSYRAFDRAVDHVIDAYPQRAPLDDLRWSWHEPEMGLDYVNFLFTAEDWIVRVHDPDSTRLDSSVSVIISSDLTKFRWEGFVKGEKVEGWLASGGIVPKMNQGSGATDERLWYINDRYGYAFQYDAAATITETGVSFFDLNELPEGMSQEAYLYQLYADYGPRLCVKLELGDGYILFDPPENHSANYTFCRRVGATSGTVTERVETVTIEGVQYIAEGDEFAKTDGGHDESLAIDLHSGMRIEFGGYASDDASFGSYRQEILPILLDILETYVSLPKLGDPS